MRALLAGAAARRGTFAAAARYAVAIVGAALVATVILNVVAGGEDEAVAGDATADGPNALLIIVFWAAKGVLLNEELEQHQLTAEEQERLGAERAKFIDRIFFVLREQAEGLKSRDPDEPTPPQL